MFTSRPGNSIMKAYKGDMQRRSPKERKFMHMSEIAVTKENFEDIVMKSEIPVIVDFWAGWCAPCMMLAPTLAEIAEENEGKLTVAKVNVDEQPELAGAFGISGIPTVLVVKEGKITAKSVGYRGKDAIMGLLDQ